MAGSAQTSPFTSPTATPLPIPAIKIDQVTCPDTLVKATNQCSLTTITNTSANDYTQPNTKLFFAEYLNGSGQVDLWQPSYGFGEALPLLDRERASRDGEPVSARLQDGVDRRLPLLDVDDYLFRPRTAKRLDGIRPCTSGLGGGE